MVEVAEEDVEIDCFFFEDMFPFRVWDSLRSRGHSPNLVFGKSKVFLDSCECSPSESSALIQFSGLSFDLSGIPREFRLIE